MSLYYLFCLSAFRFTFCKPSSYLYLDRSSHCYISCFSSLFASCMPSISHIVYIACCCVPGKTLLFGLYTVCMLRRLSLQLFRCCNCAQSTVITCQIIFVFNTICNAHNTTLLSGCRVSRDGTKTLHGMYEWVDGININCRGMCDVSCDREWITNIVSISFIYFWK